MTAWLDGALVPTSSLPKRGGVAPFETMGARAGELPLWDDHLTRLHRAAERLALPFVVDARLRAMAQELLRGNGHHDDVLRLLLLPSGARVHTVMTTRARSPITTVRLLPTVVARPANAPPADLKAEPRSFHDLVRQQAQDGGADDGLIVAPDGRVLEASYGTLWLRRNGRWCTPPLDGAVLPGVGRARLLAAAAAAGVAIDERPLGLGDLHAAEALAHGNAVYGPRAACLVGQAPAVAFVDSELGALWRRATAG